MFDNLSRLFSETALWLWQVIPKIKAHNTVKLLTTGTPIFLQNEGAPHWLISQHAAHLKQAYPAILAVEMFAIELPPEMAEMVDAVVSVKKCFLRCMHGLNI